LPQPQGATDLAGPLLAALAAAPDVVAIVSDGYENTLEGDLARVVAALPGAGVQTPIVFCPSLFTGVDDLTGRRPAPALPEVPFWHEADFLPLCLRLFAQAGPAGAAAIRHFLQARLAVWHTEDSLWTTIA
jgi:hypothetical protein